MNTFRLYVSAGVQLGTAPRSQWYYFMQGLPHHEARQRWTSNKLSRRRRQGWTIHQIESPNAVLTRFLVFTSTLLLGRHLIMAEVFAAAASGAGLISLAIQLADCAVKLKSFCDQVEKAPKSLRRLPRELTTFALLLRQIDGIRVAHDSNDSDALAESFELCRECTKEIYEAIRSLQAISRKYNAAGRVYSALKFRDVVLLCADLERSKNSLMVAFQVLDHRTQVRAMGASRDTAMQHSLLLFSTASSLIGYDRILLFFWEDLRCQSQL